MASNIVDRSFLGLVRSEWDNGENLIRSLVLSWHQVASNPAHPVASEVIAIRVRIDASTPVTGILELRTGVVEWAIREKDPWPGFFHLATGL